ncbi:cytochrome c [Leptothoe kymatousa]|uniref:Cytochrome c n=1 Tax=Leptothoe kymatousa TAU-MAC 1615 TaxID=2364775 RepID=A0ABS5Y772_9CYAN|nr:cytochrome c [Leptothoe kymatousa]MBT9313348.1 cytochrome c [Leptothoe kymatousa TAU-MAC 1615]
MTQNAIDSPSLNPSPPDSQTNRLIVQFVLAATIILVCVLLVVWGIHKVQVSDPYVHDVLTSNGRLERGQQLFWQNCATCHGLKGTGEVGPDLQHVSERKSQIALIKQVTSGKTPPMPQFQPNTQDMADLLEFLNSL